MVYCDLSSAHRAVKKARKKDDLGLHGDQKAHLLWQYLTLYLDHFLRHSQWLHHPVQHSRCQAPRDLQLEQKKLSNVSMV